MPKNVILPFYTALLGLIMLAVVPRKEIRRLGPYAVLLAVSTDIFNIIVFTKLLGVGGYMNYEPYGFLGIPFFSTMAVSVYIIIYLYFLPGTPKWNLFFVFMGAAFSTLFSNVQVKLGIFKWNYGQVLVPFLIFLFAHAVVTWGYLWLTSTEKT